MINPDEADTRRERDQGRIQQGAAGRTRHPAGPAKHRDVLEGRPGWRRKVRANTRDDASESSDVASKKTNIAAEKTDAASIKTDDASIKTDAASETTDAASEKADAVSIKTDDASEKADAASVKTDAGSEKADAVSIKTDDASGVTDSVSETSDVASGVTDSESRAPGHGFCPAREVAPRAALPQFAMQLLKSTMQLVETHVSHAVVLPRAPTPHHLRSVIV
jgi:hypothetical protein